MANEFVTTTVALRQFAILLRNNLVATMCFTMARPTNEGGRAIGETVRCSLPINPTVSRLAKGGSLTYQDVEEPQVDLELEYHENVPIKVSSWDKARNLEDLTEQVLMPAATALAEKVDRDILGKLNQVPNYVGTATDPPDSMADFTAIRRKLNNQKVPMADRFALLDPDAESDALNLDSFVQADKRGSAETIMMGEIGYVLGINFKMSQNIPTQGNASASTGWLVNEATASDRDAGTTALAIDTGTNNPEAGDVFVVAGDTVQHVVNRYAASAIHFSPPLGAQVANNAAITFVAQHVINFAGHPLCMGLTFAELQPLGGGAESETFMDPSGIVVRYTRGHSMAEMADLINLDVLLGARVIRPELGVRILG